MDRKKITDKIRNFLKSAVFEKEYRMTAAFGVLAIVLLIGCIFYAGKRNSGWEIPLTAVMAEEDTYPTAVVEGNTAGNSAAGDSQSADGTNNGGGSTASEEAEGERKDAESVGDDDENSGVTGSENSDQLTAADEENEESEEAVDETLTGENAITFDVEIKTTEEVSDAVPRITFINEDYEIPADAELPYYIKVNTALNCVTVYGIDENGEYTIPVRAMACSTAKEGKVTPTGTFAISNRASWMLMVDNTYAQYATRFNGKILFHAVPCNSQNKDDLETEEFNKLGEVASLGCVRLCVSDAKWIYDNCPEGTGVEVYEDETSPGPMGKPVMIKIPEDSEYAGWDPTDPDEENPWNSVRPSVQITGSLKVAAGTTVTEEMLLDGVTATDTCGNDITEYVGIINIHYIYAGYDMWQVQYYVVDSLGKTGYTYRMITLE